MCSLLRTHNVGPTVYVTARFLRWCGKFLFRENLTCKTFCSSWNEPFEKCFEKKEIMALLFSSISWKKVVSLRTILQKSKLNSLHCACQVVNSCFPKVETSKREIHTVSTQRRRSRRQQIISRIIDSENPEKWRICKHQVTE